jgi:Zn-dependent protease with chaperone function
MKRIVTLLALTLMFSAASMAQIKIGGKKLDSQKLGSAAKNAATAITLSDADVVNLCREAIEWMDANNPVSPEDSEYSKRLNRIVDQIGPVNIRGMKLNYKVYEVIDINAFACGDGSIRVFSSLMDIMTDDELAAIIGHEIGHIANNDVKDAIKNAYLTSAAVDAVGATGDTAKKLSDSELGDLAKSFTGAQFSQKQENEADDYALKILIQGGFDPYGMSNALLKFIELSNGAESSRIQQMFSSHPESAKRSERMKKQADKHVGK